MSESTIHPLPIDPGGVFDSDLHRRVCGHLPHDDGDEATLDSIALADLASRLNIDPDSMRKAGKAPDVQLVPWSEDDLLAVLKALESDGYATVDAAGNWTASKAGIEALSGPVLTHNEGGKLVEPPPMEGERLKQAEAANAAEAEEAAAGEKEGLEARVKDLQRQLDEAKADLKAAK